MFFSRKIVAGTAEGVTETVLVTIERKVKLATRAASSRQLMDLSENIRTVTSKVQALSSQINDALGVRYSKVSQLIEGLMDCTDNINALIEKDISEDSLGAVLQLMDGRKEVATSLIRSNQKLALQRQQLTEETVKIFGEVSRMVADSAKGIQEILVDRDKSVAEIESNSAIEIERIKMIMMRDQLEAMHKKQEVLASRDEAIRQAAMLAEENWHKTQEAIKELDIEKQRIIAETEHVVKAEAERKKAEYNKKVEEEFERVYKRHLDEVARIRAMEKSLSQDKERNFEIDNVVKEPQLKEDERGFLFIVPAEYQTNMKGTKPVVNKTIHHHQGGGGRGGCNIL